MRCLHMLTAFFCLSACEFRPFQSDVQCRSIFIRLKIRGQDLVLNETEHCPCQEMHSAPGKQDCCIPASIAVYTIPMGIQMSHRNGWAPSGATEMHKGKGVLGSKCNATTRVRTAARPEFIARSRICAQSGPRVVQRQVLVLLVLSDEFFSTPPCSFNRGIVQRPSVRKADMMGGGPGSYVDGRSAQLQCEISAHPVP